MTLDVLLLRFDAPLMSFGGVAVDEHRVTDEAPGLSLLAGLLANALGYDHADVEQLERLQARLRHAVRRDRLGRTLVDYQTVALGEPWMEPAWTTWGRPATRKGAFSDETHIRRRHYWADSVFTLAMTLECPDERPTLNDIERALREPERPLFLGRKTCLPAAPILLGRTRADSLKKAVEWAPLVARRGTPAAMTGRRTEGDPPQPLTLWWPDGDGSTDKGEHVPFRFPTYDRRDWANQIHTGRRFVNRASMPSPEEPSDGN